MYDSAILDILSRQSHSLISMFQHTC